MASTLIDSRIFQGIFSSEAMREVWSDENRTAKYIDVERALAKVQAGLGLIPQEAAAEIISHCEQDEIDMERLRQQTERLGYPILGVVTQINPLCRDKLGEFVHWGATTQDITDTATVLQIREALALVETDLKALANALAKLAQAACDGGAARDRAGSPGRAAGRVRGELHAPPPSAAELGQAAQARLS